MEILLTVNEVSKGFSGQEYRPDIEAQVAAGIFEECVAAIEATAAGGSEQLYDVAPWPLYGALRVVLYCHSHPKCEARIRSLATALDFCLAHDLVCVEEISLTTASLAASIGEPASATPTARCAPAARNICSR